MSARSKLHEEDHHCECSGGASSPPNCRGRNTATSMVVVLLPLQMVGGTEHRSIPTSVMSHSRSRIGRVSYPFKFMLTCAFSKCDDASIMRITGAGDSRWLQGESELRRWISLVKTTWKEGGCPNPSFNGSLVHNYDAGYAFW